MRNKFLISSTLIIIFVAICFYVTFQFIQPTPKKEITIATGSKTAEYYNTALKYKELLEKEKVKVNIIETNGSIENIELLNNKKVDIAFVQNGTINANNNIEVLSSIYFEPLWIFYNKNILNPTYIKDFLNKKISIGSLKSGTENLALEILNINGIDSNNTKLMNLNTNESKDALKKGEIDAMFIVTSPNSTIIKELLLDENIYLFSFKRANAYSKKFTYLNSITLYEGTVNLNDNLPHENKNLLATTALLVTHKDFSDELVRIFLKKVKEVNSTKTLFSHENEFPNLSNINENINEEAQRYLAQGDTWLEKIFPFWIASNIDRLKILLIPLLTLLIPISKGLFPLYRWSIRSKIYRWYDELQSIDLSLEGLEKEELKKKLIELEKLKKEIKEDTKVPLSYMGEYYDLIMHIELIISKTNIRIQSN